MDEFFRVRVANLQRALLVDEKSTTTLGFGVRETLSQVGQRVLELQSQYNEAYETVLDAMREAKIHILNEEEYWMRSASSLRITSSSASVRTWCPS